MKRGYHIFTGLTFAIISLVSVSQPICAAERGEKSLGLRGGYVTRNESALAGLYFQYNFTDFFRLSPNIDYVFRHHDEDALDLNLNAHFLFKVGTSGRFNMYPLVGVNYTSWNLHYQDENSDDVTTRDSRLSLNIGGGMEYYVTSTLKLNLEGKFQWAKHFNTGMFSVGIGYVF